jgi:YVTN family beta-propeller protein
MLPDSGEELCYGPTARQPSGSTCPPPQQTWRSVHTPAKLAVILAMMITVAGCTSVTQSPDRQINTGIRTGVPDPSVSSAPISNHPGPAPAAAPTTATSLIARASPQPPRTPWTSKPPRSSTLPGMPKVTDPRNIYAAASAGMLTALSRTYPAYAYVPHNRSGDVWVLNQRTGAVVNKCHVGIEIQHVVPSYDMTQLYATDDLGDVIRVIDPRTGQCGRTIKIKDPYNMYFTPDGKYAISVAENYRQLVFYDPHTWKIHDTTTITACAGIDHADFSADGKTMVFTCEFAGRVAVVDVATHRLLRVIDMPTRNTTMGPQDIKLSPDGQTYYIADSQSGGLWVLPAGATAVTRHIATGRGAHGLYLSRDARNLYVTNRLEGSVSVLDADTGKVLTKWRIPGGGSPDMGNVSVDGSQLWLSGRYDNVVYVLATTDGHLIKKVPVGQGPHGLALMPLPGRYSLGHTGITR